MTPSFHARQLTACHILVTSTRSCPHQSHSQHSCQSSSTARPSTQSL